MRQIIIISTVVIAAFLIIITSCKRELKPVNEGNIQFSYQVKSDDNSLKSTNSLDQTALILSVVNSAGEEVFTNRRVELFFINEQMVTEAISMPSGIYRITAFAIIDDLNNITYAVPIEESDNSKLVNDALPVEIEIMANQTNNQAIEVISTHNQQPEMFGFTAFNVEVRETFPITIGLQTFNEQINEYESITGYLNIISEDSVLTHMELKEPINKVVVPEGYSEYTMIISPNGDFPHYTYTFTSDSLKSYSTMYGNQNLTISFVQDYPDLNENIIAYMNADSAKMYVKPDEISEVLANYAAVEISTGLYEMDAYNFDGSIYPLQFSIVPTEVPHQVSLIERKVKKKKPSTRTYRGVICDPIPVYDAWEWRCVHYAKITSSGIDSTCSYMLKKEPIYRCRLKGSPNDRCKEWDQDREVMVIFKENFCKGTPVDTRTKKTRGCRP
ncbi:MAG: hypothetical protein MI922_03680 [Bacteroidales bacterium]|nr:hypothetical protein [Bacteroidales bacterium]